MPVAVFVHIPLDPHDDDVDVETPSTQNHEHACVCCSQHEHEESEKHHALDTEALYGEDHNWVDAVSKDIISQDSQDHLLKSIRALRRVGSRLVVSRIQEDPKGVKRDLQAWLGDQAFKLDASVGLVEVFTGKANLSKQYEAKTGLHAIRLGLEYGQDFKRLQDRKNLLLLIAFCRPHHIWVSFPCQHWGPWSRFNMARSPEQKQEILSQRATARRYLHNISEAWHLQVALGGHIHIENPLSSDAWCELNLGKAWSVRVDQCSLGLRCPKTNLPVLKATRIVTSQESLANQLVSCRCDGKHDHQHLEGNYKGQNLTKWAETYPNKFCRVMVDGFIQSKPSKSRNRPVEEVLAAEEDWDYDIDEDPLFQPDRDGQVVERDKGTIKSKLSAKALVYKLHTNTGHSSKEQMMRLAVRCQASDEIKKAISEFKCGICDELKPIPSHRKTTIPHAESPNQIVGIDFVQVELHREDELGEQYQVTRNVLTCVDLATDFCQQVIVQPGPDSLAKAFHRAWGRPYGVPKTIYMDPDRRFMSTEFQQYLVHNNVELLLCGAESHWQLGRVEIANRILRNMARRVWKTSPRPAEEVIEACASIRNDQLRKAGYSPSQWFLGREPRQAGALSNVEEIKSGVSITCFVRPIFRCTNGPERTSRQSLHR